MYTYPSSQNNHLRKAVGVALVLFHPMPASAQWGGFGPGGGGGGGNGDGSGPPSFPGFGGSGSSDGNNGFGPPGGFRGPGFDIQAATRHRTIHGILASLAFVLLFPLGSILMRVVPGRFAIWAHALMQITAYVVYVAAAALGFWMVQEVRLPFVGGSLLEFSAINYHPIIGIVVLVTLTIQPFLGLIHHSRFKRLGRRQIWSYLHLWNGRLTLPLGVVNGGLGLRLAGASTTVKVAYAVVAAIMFAIWFIVAVFAEWRRARRARREVRGRHRGVKAAEGGEVAPRGA